MHRIILFGKSKRRTRTTFHLARAFKECGNTVPWLNPAKIRRYRKNESDRWILNKIKAFFENKGHLVWYHSEGECLSLAEEYLAKPDMRHKIARQGYHRVHKHHTFHHFVQRAIALYARERSQVENEDMA